MRNSKSKIIAFLGDLVLNLMFSTNTPKTEIFHIFLIDNPVQYCS